MTAIEVNPSRDRSDDQADYMPTSVRIMLASTINSAWAEYVGEMGADVAHDTPERFWRYLTR